MLRSLTAALLFACGSWSSAWAADLEVLPTDVVLTGPRASQHLRVLSIANGKVIADPTEKAKFTSSNPIVASVDKTGTVHATGDGEAVITASLHGKRVTAKVKVSKTRELSAPSFRNEIIPLLTKIGCNSGACHGALAGKGGFKLSLRGYAPALDHFVMTRQALGRRVDPIEPARSLILLKPTATVSHGGGHKLEVGSPDYQIVADWIASGAPPPREEDPRIHRLEVFPPAAVLKPNDTLQVIVRAWYSDGHAADVTRWVKFNSNEDLVATVDAEGKVRVGGYGEAAITLWYSNLVAACRITSPLANALGRKVFVDAERRNYIDDLVLQKLAALRIPPSPLCTDAEFIRRAFLDATGTLPKPQEVEKFLADPAPDKRAQLINALLERPEFVDYWTYKWSDLFLVSTRKLSQQAVWAFYQYIRQSVADNKPWDHFAREILTASGSTLRNGAANYFVLHKDVSDLTEATSVTFLGMSITCCRCHNHPLEKWTQDQYWSMANLFSRVALKNGDREGEINVQSQRTGEVPHPRRGITMPPTPLDGKPLSLDSSMDRRQYFADWLTAPENPYFARAVINRVWKNFLGRGLVEAEDDLRQTNPPTNEELFAALVKDFIAHTYDIKHLIRTIMNSATYQRSSIPQPENTTDDRFYSHYLIRRLSAEVALDAYSQVTGVPTPFTQVHSGGTGGFTAYGGYPLGTRALQLPDSQVASRFLDAFGRPDRTQTCSCERQQDSSVSQALHLNNGQSLNDKIRDKSCRVEAWVQEKISDEDALQRLFLLALSRKPLPDELKKFKELMAAEKGTVPLRIEGQSPSRAAAAEDRQITRRELLEDLFWAVLTGREFLFNH
jgi:hypothetical protein